MWRIVKQKLTRMEPERFRDWQFDFCRDFASGHDFINKIISKKIILHLY